MVIPNDNYGIKWLFLAILAIIIMALARIII